VDGRERKRKRKRKREREREREEKMREEWDRTGRGEKIHPPTSSPSRVARTGGRRGLRASVPP